MSLAVLSTGIGYGKVYKVEKSDSQNNRFVDHQSEILHFLETKKVVYQLLENLKNNTSSDEIITFQQAILIDQLLENEVKTKIRTKQLSAKQAFKSSIQNYIDSLSNLEDAYLKERMHDLEDLSERLSLALDQKEKTKILEPIILCVDILYPSYLFEYENHIQGVIVKQGSSLSHGVILAKERNIPCIISNDLNPNLGDYIFMDGYHSKIIVNPTTTEVESWLKVKNKEDEDLSLSHFPNKLCLNVSGETPVDPKYVVASDGIGLYRSEFLYFQKNAFPSIDKQVAVYGQFLKQFHPKPVVIRTYDFGDDKNPLNLGALQRGVSDYFIHYEKPFVEQLSALLVLNETFDNLKIMIPMVKTKADYDAVYKLLENLHHKFGFSRPLPPLGVMIETEDAFMHLSDFTGVDFFSIGSNDLGKSLFDIDRFNPMDESTYAKMMIKAIEEITEFAKHHQIPCTVCGDIASRPLALSMMLERGIHNFSIPMPFLKDAKKIIKQHKIKNMKS